MTTMTLISIILAVLGMGIAIKKTKQLPESISAMVYSLGKPWQWLWSAWIVAMTMTAMIPLMDIMPEQWKFISFLSMACLTFVAVMPLVYEERRLWHYALAITGGILSQVCVAMVSPWCLLLWFLYIPLTANIWQWTYGKGVLIAEVLAMACVWGCCLI